MARNVFHTIYKDIKPLEAFWNKFNNDWAWCNAAGLAFSLLLSVFPLVIAFLSLLGFFLGGLDPADYDRLLNQIIHVFPAVTSSQSIIGLALKQLAKQSGILGLFALGLAIFNGSRLFLFLEGCLDIMYHVRPRGVVAQNVMAVLMLLLYVILIPIMFLASSLPALVTSFLQKTPLSQIPGSGLLFGLSGIFGGFIASYILFQTIYVVVPNQKISFRHTWLGAVIAAALLEVYLVLFPLYVTYFLGIFAGALGLLILLVFFYYFAMILFLGAEINAFFSAKIYETRYDLVTMVHVVTNQAPASNEGVVVPVVAGQKDEKPQDVPANDTIAQVPMAAIRHEDEKPQERLDTP